MEKDEFNSLNAEYVDRFELEMEALFEGANMLGDYLLGTVVRTPGFEQNLKRWQKAKDEMRKFYD